MAAGHAEAQRTGGQEIEVPLRVEDGRMVVTVDHPSGAQYDFVLGLGMTLLTESAVAEMGDGLDALTLAGIPVVTDQAQTVPDDRLGLGPGKAGVFGGLTLTAYDALFDVPNGVLRLKPVGRSVSWEGVELTNPVQFRLFHDVLIRVDIQVGGEVFGGLLDLSQADLEVNAPLEEKAGLDGQTTDSFRMGYAGWPELPVRVTDSPIFRGWDGDGLGFAVIGAAVALDCALAISWTHTEFRTCVR